MKQHLERAINIISAISVTGDAQDLAVAAKNELRAALAELEQRNKEWQEKPLHEFDPNKTEEVHHE